MPNSNVLDFKNASTTRILSPTKITWKSAQNQTNLGDRVPTLYKV